MNKVGKIEFRKLKRISPSQYYSMKNCTYKSLLAEAFEKKPLLPVSPNAYFGMVLHKMLELIAKGAISNEDDFNTLFDEQVQFQEQILQRQGYDFFIPLQKNVKDYGVKKILLKKHLRNVSEKRVPSSSVKYYSERPVESKDKLIAGKIDLVIEEVRRIEILDFKTGVIMQDVLDDDGELFSEIKEEYKEQLKLYAYLYFENTGNFPTQLSLVDLAKQKFTVEFSQQECNTIFGEAKKILSDTNNSVEEGKFIANPSEVNCKYCLYRPACSFYLKLLESDYSFSDVVGFVRNVVTYQNGNVSVFLENGDKKITVTRLSFAKYDELNKKINKRISIFNLRKEATEFVYSAIKTTMIYEET